MVIRSWQDLVTGPNLNTAATPKPAYMKQPTFVLVWDKGRGKADELQFTGPDQYRIQRGSYSTCAGDAPAWRLEVAQLDLDENTSVGVARDARIYLGNLPVAWLPQFSFPRRTSAEWVSWRRLTAPVANPRPRYSATVLLQSCANYDATFTPRLMSKRGVLFNGPPDIFDTPFWTGDWRLER